MTYFVNITSQGQMSVPAAVRRQLGIRTGEQVAVDIQGKKMTVEPVPDILSLRGIFKTKKRIPWKKVRAMLDEAWAHGKI